MLIDPIQYRKISLECFSSFNNKNDAEKIDLTHDEAVNKNKYYWDKKMNCILSSARPTNLFWSFHLSNMIQQDFTLKDFFTWIENVIQKRKRLF